MPKRRTPLFFVNTPFPGVPDVTLFEDSWENRVVARHTYMADKLLVVQGIAESPTHVLPGGSSNEDFVIFVNEAVTTPGGSLLSVIIDPKERLIITAYPDRKLKLIEPTKALWYPR